MKVTWTKQEKTDDPKQALEMSIAKWRFFTYCTKDQLSDRILEAGEPCGLCGYYEDFNKSPAVRCRSCPFSTLKRKNGRLGPYWSCHSVYREPSSMAFSWWCLPPFLKDFHAAAREVWEKLKSLRTQ